MLLKLLATPIWGIIEIIINQVPHDIVMGSVHSSFADILGFGIYVIGLPNFILMMGSVMIWNVIHLLVAVVVFVLRKVPFLGIN